MPKEEQPTPLSAIHIDLARRSITLEAEAGTVGRLTFGASGIVFQPSPRLLPSTQDANAQLETAQEATNGEPPKERDPRIVVAGRLVTKPTEGRSDRKGKPTAWAKLEAEKEGRDGTHRYLASFYGRTTEIALSLDRNAELTAHGYVRPSEDPDRLDTLSVVHLSEYPGKKGD